MIWQQWEPTYAAILADFGWCAADDARSARALDQQLVDRPSPWHDIEAMLGGDAVVVGCGPSLHELSRHDLPAATVVAADGATTWCREQGIVPEIVVTDLDGDLEDLLWASGHGAIMIVHAHGANVNAVQTAVPQLTGPVAGTCQGNPDEAATLRNYGGFTDGDRAALLAQHLGAKTALAGFDLDHAPSRYSHRWDPAVKARKLAWAKRILDENGLTAHALRPVPTPHTRR